jgi:UDP-N-acetyl-D-glucosamine dehydrogenase
MSSDLRNRLSERINSRSAIVTVVGLGHVGLPLATAFAKAGYSTIGVDSDRKRLALITSGKVSLEDDSDNREVAELIRAGKLHLTGQIAYAVTKADCVAICVPTPVLKDTTPDISIISDVLKTTGRCLSPGKIIVVESTVYPGFTSDVAQRILESNRLRCGRDFCLAYSPERIDPGNKKYRIAMIPKIVGGVDEVSCEMGALLYESVIKAGVVRVSDAKTAECTKMLENVYRFVNIALVDELALLCERIGVNIYEVVAAASSKPFGFSPHLPGPGIGGPCIPKDPFYLEYAARKAGMRLTLVKASEKVNETMAVALVSRVQREMKRLRRKSPKIAIFGLAYKAESYSTVNSPAISIISRLEASRAKLSLFDPYVRSIRVEGRSLMSESSAMAASTAADCLVFLVNHEKLANISLKKLKARAGEECVLLDARNIFRADEAEAAGFRYIGLGKP